MHLMTCHGCDRDGQIPLRIGHLTALQELTVRGSDLAVGLYVHHFFDQQGQAGAEPALPTSLRVLRFGESASRLCPFIMYPRPAAVAPVTIPVLDFHAENLVLILGRPGGAADIHGHADDCFLPDGFETLQLCTECIAFNRVRPSGVTWCPETTPPEEQLCQFFAVAPECYTDFRICAPPGKPPTAAPDVELEGDSESESEPDWNSDAESDWEAVSDNGPQSGRAVSSDGKQRGRGARFDSLGALAEAMTGTSVGGSLDICLGHDQQYVRITRPGTLA